MRLDRLRNWSAALIGFTAQFSNAGTLRFEIRSAPETLVPCRMHVIDENGQPHNPPGLPFWKGGFVCDGRAALDVPRGRYRYEIERGPEWRAVRGAVEVSDDVMVNVTLERLADLKEEGWFGGDLHVHRAPDELPLHLRAEDLSIASVQTWWNRTNPWKNGAPASPVKRVEGRYHDILSGEDERGGGALLFHRMKETVAITEAEREWPPSVTFLEAAKQAGGWVEIEKPFWWDTPLWLSTGMVESVGIAQNHMQRRGVLGNEAWGRPRDTERFPGVHGNGLYTQDLYYKILNCGFRLPPSAGSASGVLANPVGYNRVYVHTGPEFGWDAWWEGLREGRCFVTNGPLLRVTANESLPGTVLRSDGPLEVRLEGALDSQDRIDRVEVVINGAIEETEFPAPITIDKSGWFLVRAIADVDETFRFASTAPWYVQIDGEPMQPDRAAAAFFLEWAKERKAMVDQALDDEAKRREVVAKHESAVRYWENRVPRSVPVSARGAAQVEVTRPRFFPHRIWAACDFEVRTPDYAWFGPAEKENIPRYPGNATALGVGERPYRDFSALMTGINPVPGPRMGKINQLYLRYFLRGGTKATFQHFSLSSEDNNHIRLGGLTEGKWSEATMNFTRDGRRNDGTPGVPFQEGERMDDLKIFVGKPNDGKDYELLIDDVIFFATEPGRPPEPEPFPRRIIYLAGFDTGVTPEEKPKYWPGEFEIAQRDLPEGSLWNAARAVPRKDGNGKWIRLQLDPIRTVGAHTKLRFRSHLTGSRRMTVQIFDATDQDNRHINLDGLEPKTWQTHYLDFTRDACRNDGSDTPFAAGHTVDDLFFFVQPDGDEPVDLLIDEVVLFDAGEADRHEEP